MTDGTAFETSRPGARKARRCASISIPRPMRRGPACARASIAAAACSASGPLRRRRGLQVGRQACRRRARDAR
jgi:hypothetical protein